MSQNANNRDDGGFGTGFGTSTFGGGDMNGGGEFGTNNFGGGTNAVSQIFKEAGGADEERKRRIIIYSALGLALAASLGVGWWFMNESAGEMAAPQVSHVAPPPAAAAVVPEVSAETAEAETDGDPEAASAPAEAPKPAASEVTGSDEWVYNEEKGGVVIAAREGATIEVARSSGFADTYVRGVAKGGSFRIPNPPPGKVFWREQGSAQARAITVKHPPTLGLHLDAPGSLSAGGSLSWSSSAAPAYFRVDFAPDAGFQEVSASFSTTQNTLSPKSLQPGKWFVRLGGYNKASGKWEWTSPSSITVQ